MKILLTQLRRIGDVITTTPAVRAVRAAWPAAQIDFLTEPPSDEIYRYNPHITNLITISRRPGFSEFLSLIRRLRVEKYDVVIDFFCNPTSAYITFLTGAKTRVGFNVRVRKIFYNYKADTSLFPPHLYAGIHKLILTSLIGAVPVGYEPEFFINSESQKQADTLLSELGCRFDGKLVTLGIVTRHSFRQWPLERFAMLADLLIENFDVQILFIYGPNESDRAAKIQSMMKNKALPLYTDGSLCRLRGIFERSALHVGCDNGPANIAKASAIPNVIIYSNTRASSWTPPANKNFVGIESILKCKDSCLHEGCKEPLCVLNITVDEVYLAASKFLSKL